ncbi:ABC transporter ATP-binding protein [Paenibacillus spiritus]|uniref:ABC transporter ATP-binding protein n=1 Tax=Paenibacillus spiritus TaxID=2496557 RepID=A0A5J5FT56_9BACL|nr:MULTISPECIES: ABC transporter ATP-binding protein [Paenibacillus]KAA8996233.1 ABC transporter ATP-binding protein [Paenibacillus spiritus]
MNVLEIDQLCKSFGDHPVIDGLNLSVPEHAVFGLMGQNGAGKTTTMRMVLGLLKPDSGTISVCGERAVYGETAANRHIGYLPDVPEFYAYMRPLEYLRLCGEITGMRPDRLRARSEELLQAAGLWEARRRRIGGFSRGMKQRLGIAQALLNEPRLLICDEPTSALDPIGRKDILGLLSAARGSTTVLLSTHILSDVERICDRVAVLHQGRIVLEGALGDIRRRGTQDGYRVEFADDGTAEALAACEELRSAGAQAERSGSAVTVKLPAESGGQLLIDLLSKRQWAPVKLERLEPSLESLFLEAVQ